MEELEQRMSLREFRQWGEFSVLEPLPSERVDLMAALITSTLANINRTKTSRPFTIADFMIVQKALEEKSVDRDQQEANHLLATILALGGSAP